VTTPTNELLDRRVHIISDSVGLATDSKLDEIITKLGGVSSGIPLIPAQYYAGNNIVSGNSGYSGGTFTSGYYSVSGRYWYSSTAGDYIDFEFYGSFVNVVFYRKSGVANIYIDDMTTVYATVDVSALKGPCYNLVWVGPDNLSEDYHTIRIEVSSGTVYVVGILVDGSKNAWRIRPFPNNLDYLLSSMANNAFVAANGIYVVPVSRYVAVLYTTTPLAAGGTWTSSSYDTAATSSSSKYLRITCYSDVDGTIYVDYSPDGTNWDAIESIAYTGGTTPAIDPIRLKGRYVRVRYVNGTTDQTVFRLYAHLMRE